MTQNDHEHKAFERFCIDNNMARGLHPLHLLYLNHETASALDVFKAGYLAGQDKSLGINQLCGKHYDWVERMGWHNKTVLEALALVA